VSEALLIAVFGWGLAVMAGLLRVMQRLTSIETDVAWLRRDHDRRHNPQESPYGS
jgi:hypothetical protein